MGVRTVREALYEYRCDRCGYRSHKGSGFVSPIDLTPLGWKISLTDTREARPLICDRCLEELVDWLHPGAEARDVG